jgi:hypothetical protein
MLDILSILGIILAFLIGYQFPRKAGWGVLLIAPILGPATFTFVPSMLLPLTTYRVAFAITMGVILRNHDRHGIPLSSIFKSMFVKIVVVFSLFVICISLKDGAQMKNLLFRYIPWVTTALVISYYTVKDEADLQRLVNILVWQAAIVGLFIFLEYFTDFDIKMILRSTIPEYDLSKLSSKLYEAKTRTGFYRPSGIDGSAVHTAYRLAFLFPLTLWYARGGRLWKFLPVIMVLLSLMLLQTRAAVVGILCGFIPLSIGLALSKRTRTSVRLSSTIKYMVIICILVVVVVIFEPSILKIGYLFISKTFLSSFTDTDILATKNKLLRIPFAINLFMEGSLLGYGSPYHVLSIKMGSADIPAPFIYLLSGGIFLGLLYLLMIITLPLSVFRAAIKLRLRPEQKKFLVYACAAFTCGIVVVFSNWVESHFFIMYILYISIYKVYLHKGATKVRAVVTQ